MKSSVTWKLVSMGGLFSAAKSLASIQPTAAKMAELVPTMASQRRMANRGLVRFFRRFFFFLVAGAALRGAFCSPPGAALWGGRSPPAGALRGGSPLRRATSPASQLVVL